MSESSSRVMFKSEMEQFLEMETLSIERLLEWDDVIRFYCRDHVHMVVDVCNQYLATGGWYVFARINGMLDRNQWVIDQKLQEYRNTLHLESEIKLAS